MKLVRYGTTGQEKPGMIDADGTLRDLSAHVADITGATLGDDIIAKLRALDPATLPTVDGNPRMGACVGDIGKFMCIGLNYADHAAETGADIPEHPILFMKANSAITGPNDDVVMPRGSATTDWEVELGTGNFSQEKELFDLIITDENATPELLPDRIIFTQKIFWGENGILRKTGIAPLNLENREKEFRLL